MNGALFWAHFLRLELLLSYPNLVTSTLKRAQLSTRNTRVICAYFAQLLHANLRVFYVEICASFALCFQRLSS